MIQRRLTLHDFGEHRQESLDGLGCDMATGSFEEMRVKVTCPMQVMQILRKTTLHDVPAVQADILTLHKLLQHVSEGATQSGG